MKGINIEPSCPSAFAPTIHPFPAIHIIIHTVETQSAAYFASYTYSTVNSSVIIIAASVPSVASIILVEGPVAHKARVMLKDGVLKPPAPEELSSKQGHQAFPFCSWENLLIHD
jgi:hypothetical protein